VEAVADLWLLRAVDVFHDVPDLVGALQGDRQTSIELGVIPVLLGLLLNTLLALPSWLA